MLSAGLRSACASLRLSGMLSGHEKKESKLCSNVGLLQVQGWQNYCSERSEDRSYRHGKHTKLKLTVPEQTSSICIVICDSTKNTRRSTQHASAHQHALPPRNPKLFCNSSVPLSSQYLVRCPDLCLLGLTHASEAIHDCSSATTACMCLWSLPATNLHWQQGL